MLDTLSTGEVSQTLITIGTVIGVAVGAAVAAYRGYKSPDRRNFKPPPIANSIDAMIVAVRHLQDDLSAVATHDQVKKLHNHLGKLESGLKECKDMIKATEGDIKTFHEQDILKLEKLTQLEKKMERILEGIITLEAKH